MEWTTGFVLQCFYNGLLTSSRGHLDAAAGGAFLDLTITTANQLIEKMVSNQGWSDERTQTQGQSKGMHTVKETDMSAAKLDALMKRIDDKRRQEFSKPSTLLAHTLRVKFVATMGIWGMIAQKLAKMWLS